jgi:alkylation response protein AidB-like acyl-CoA dehydrogenase
VTWFDAALSPDQTDVVDLIAAVVGKHGEALDDHADDDHAGVGPARDALAQSGLWTLGIPEEHGGGGASLSLRLTALCALGQRWTAFGWACAQAHAAAEIVGGRDIAGVLSAVHAAQPVTVVDLSAPWVELQIESGRVHGTVWRLDPAGEDPYILVLADNSTAWVLPPSSVRRAHVLRHTGMAGALTVTAEIDTNLRGQDVQADVPVDDVLARLRLSGAAVAAGIALEAAERSLAYAQTRIQFGAPVIELPTVRGAMFRQAQQATDAFTLALSTEASPMRTAAVLAGNCERAIEVATAAVQSHGGYGYLAEYGVECLLRNAVSLRAATAAISDLPAVAAALAHRHSRSTAPYREMRR